MTDYIYTADAQTDLDVDWTFTSPTAGDGVQPGNTAGRWSFETAETTSSGVGPYQGAQESPSLGGSGAGYIYTEMSSQADGDVWTMTWDQNMDASANDYQFSFWWCARGDDAGALIEVQTNEDGAGWVTRLVTGSDQNPGSPTGDETVPATSAVEGSTPWHRKEVDLTGIISDAVCQIRIQITCDTIATTANFWHNDIGIDSILIVETAAATGASFDQTSFQGYDDDGGEGAATDKAAVNTDWTQLPDENFRVRFLIQEDDDVEELDVGYQLQARIVASPENAWTEVNGSSNICRSFASSEFADGAVTTQQIGAGTFIDGYMDESDGIAGGDSPGINFSTTINEETEVEFCCQLRSADISHGESVELRVVQRFAAGSPETVPLATYTSTPTLSTPVGRGMLLASATMLKAPESPITAENPGVFDFERSLPWGAITLALRPGGATGGSNFSPTSKFRGARTTGDVTVRNGASIDDMYFDADVTLDEVIDIDNAQIDGTLFFTQGGTYNFSDTVIDTVDQIIGSPGGSPSEVTIFLTGNSSITTNLDPGRINIIVSNTLTLTGLQPDTEVRIYRSGASPIEELGGIEDIASPTSFAFVYDPTDVTAIDIVIHSILYEHIRLNNVAVGFNDSTIPITQRLDRNYRNPT